MVETSIIVPCHNEAGAIREVLAGIRRAVPAAEILVVDDGSDDGTADRAAEIDGVRVIRLSPNRGKGLALQAGMGAAAGRTFVFIDGDGQDDPADLPRLLREVEAGSRFVNGSKFIGTIERGAISRPNFWGNRFMSGLIRLLFGGAVTDSQSGFRAIRRDLALSFRLRSVQYEIETEMLCQALKQGVRVTEIPVTRKARAAGATGFRRIRNGLRILWTILRERLIR